MTARPGVSDQPADAHAVPVDAMPLHRAPERPTFHVSREMVCFLGGVGIALGIMWLCREISSRKRD